MCHSHICLYYFHFARPFIRVNDNLLSRASEFLYKNYMRPAQHLALSYLTRRELYSKIRCSLSPLYICMYVYVDIISGVTSTRQILLFHIYQSNNEIYTIYNSAPFRRYVYSSLYNVEQKNALNYNIAKGQK